jgi:hypothetical protein
MNDLIKGEANFYFIAIELRLFEYDFSRNLLDLVLCTRVFKLQYALCQNIANECATIFLAAINQH